MLFPMPGFAAFSVQPKPCAPFGKDIVFAKVDPAEFLGKAMDSNGGVASSLEDGFPASSGAFLLTKFIWLAEELSCTLDCCSKIVLLGVVVGESTGLMIGRKDGLPNELVGGKGDSQPGLSFDVGDLSTKVGFSEVKG